MAGLLPAPSAKPLARGLSTGLPADMEVRVLLESRRDRSPPAAVFEWKDKESEAVGWVVMDKITNGIGGGGIFMHPSATVEEVGDIAKNMTRKFTVTRPQIGGAKAGIRYDHTRPDAKQVLRRFILHNAALLWGPWVTAGDLNTDDSFIESVIQADVGLPTCQAALGRALGAAGDKDRSAGLARLIPFPASPYFPLIEGAVGYGAAAAVQAILGLVQPALIGGARVVVQGFGAVGSSLSYYLHHSRIARVVAIADKDGILLAPGAAAEGDAALPVEALLQLRSQRAARLAADGASAAAVAECAKNAVCNLPPGAVSSPVDGVSVVTLPGLAPFHLVHRAAGRTGEEFLCDMLRAVQAEVVCPCAVRYAITPAVMSTLVEHTWKGTSQRFILAGANNVFGVPAPATGAGGHGAAAVVEDREGQVEAQWCRPHGVCVVPDWVVNSGTAQLFHRGLSMDFDLDAADRAATAHAVLEACAEPIREFVRAAWEGVRDARYLAFGCDRLAMQRIQTPLPLLPGAAFAAAGGAGGAVARGKSLYALPQLPHALAIPAATRAAAITACVQELVDPDGLLRALQRDSPWSPVAYDGFEPSGRMHIAQGLLKKAIVDTFTRNGFTFLFWVADWFAMLNHKMGGDLAKIQTVGRYFIEVWRAAGMDLTRVRFLWASEEIKARNTEYWDLLLDICRRFTQDRVRRCGQIMGRGDKEELHVSQLLYPCMQASDVFLLGVDVCQLGMDQRKVNMLAREYATAAKVESPIIASHFMLPGLKEGQEKMSKSHPDSSIWMEDSEEEVTRKVMSAFCPPPSASGGAGSAGDAAGEVINPVLVYMREIVFRLQTQEGRSVVVELPGGAAPLTFDVFADLEAAYAAGRIDPKSLKNALAKYLNAFLEPVRVHFATDANARALFAAVKEYRAL